MCLSFLSLPAHAHISPATILVSMSRGAYSHQSGTNPDSGRLPTEKIWLKRPKKRPNNTFPLPGTELIYIENINNANYNTLSSIHRINDRT